MSGWTVSVRPAKHAKTGQPIPGKLDVRAHDGQRVINSRGLTAEQVESFDPDRTWSIILANRPLR